MLISASLALAEQSFVPDYGLRVVIRRVLARRLRDIRIDEGDGENLAELFRLKYLEEAPIACISELVNAQGYKVPVDFFEMVLGPQLKFSSGYWPSGVTTLAEAERAALTELCLYADLRDGQHVLELGSGWGSLTLWMAERFPGSVITAVCQSAAQRDYVERQAHLRRLTNIRAINCDMNQFTMAESSVDRIVSVEMFEQMRNWPELFRRLSRWIKSDGRLMVQVSVHRAVPYLFSNPRASDWMNRYFVGGSMIPSEPLAQICAGPFQSVARWIWKGTHYQRTTEAWLHNMRRSHDALHSILAQTYGKDDARLWWQRWRLFFISRSELFGYRGGEEWYVCHYAFEK